MGEQMRSLNICSGADTWGDVKLDKFPQSSSVTKFDFNTNSKLPYANGAFSEIRMHQRIQFMLHPHELLKECFRVLKPGGTIDVTTVNAGSLRYLFKPLGSAYSNRNKWSREKIYTLNNLYTLKASLIKAGFKIKNAKYYAFLSAGIQVIGER